MSFSNSGGATLALPSPTHAHQMDVTSAVRGLRRSMSRSPSRFLSRTNTQSPEGSQQGSPQSPCRRFGTPPLQLQLRQPSFAQSAPPAADTTQASTTPNHSPQATPFRSSAKLSLRSAKTAKTTTPTRPLSRTRASPRSPLRRTLNTGREVANNGQNFAPSSAPESPDQENCFVGQRGSTTRRSLDKPSRHSCHIDLSGGSQDALLLKSLDTPSGSPALATSGTLKRSDATMNLDQPAQGSPVAKRRSLHGISSSPQAEDFGVFGPLPKAAANQSFEIHEDSTSEYELAGLGGGAQRDPLSSPTPGSHLPKRTSSLRKSTLQQRYGEKGSLGRRTGERQLAQMSTDASNLVGNRPRLSTDQFVPPPVPRDSPFSQGNPLPNPSIHPMDGKGHQPHPLSKALTASTSGNGLKEDAPLYAPARTAVADRPKPHPFARSLPLNATRPTARHLDDHTKAVATPGGNNPAGAGGFNSTGLISKINRNPEDEMAKVVPPDTPCKKSSSFFKTYPFEHNSALKRTPGKANNRKSFGGIPSTPHNAVGAETPGTFGNPDKGLSIFFRGTRRSSLLSLEGEDPQTQGEGADPMDGDIPPTPTRHTLTPSLSNVTESSLDSPSAHRTTAPQPPMSAVRPAVSREPTSSPVEGRRTPQTPQESMLQLDTSLLSMVRPSEACPDGNMQPPPPVTPTTDRDFRSSTSIFVTPVNARTAPVDFDSSLTQRFDKVDLVGKGEFSMVYRVTKLNHPGPSELFAATPNHALTTSPAKSQIFAVKQTKHPFNGLKDRDIKLREVGILRALSDAEHVVQYVNHWESNLHLFIQTEFCEEGTLKKFLGECGSTARLDDFRIFKILQDLLLGLKEIHDRGFMHLDLKPANILVTFEGALKIGDFGHAQPSSTARVSEEGDREYMAPEVLQRGKAAQSADIFSLGLMILETAGNVVLPENGPAWMALRSGDLSGVPSLTWNPSLDSEWDADGNPSGLPTGSGDGRSQYAGDGGDLFGSLKGPELPQAPDFMLDLTHHSSLDQIVRWMTAQEPEDRPVADQVLDLAGLRWVAENRAAPATVYEGHWGPVGSLPVLIARDGDTEMTDA